MECAHLVSGRWSLQVGLSGCLRPMSFQGFLAASTQGIYSSLPTVAPCSPLGHIK